MSEKNDNFLRSGYEKISLKMIFDHLRNIGISAAVIFAGFTLIKNPNEEDLRALIVDPDVAGWIVVSVGFILVILNYGQLLLVSNPKKGFFKVLLPALISMPVYAFTVYLLVTYLWLQ